VSATQTTEKVSKQRGNITVLYGTLFDAVGITASARRLPPAAAIGHDPLGPSFMPRVSRYRARSTKPIQKRDKYRENGYFRIFMAASKDLQKPKDSECRVLCSNLLPL